MEQTTRNKTFPLEELTKYKLVFIIDGKKNENLNLPDFLFDNYEEFMDNFCLLLY